MPNQFSKNRVPLYLRFWDALRKRGECWLWTGSIGARGYGHLSVSGRDTYAHRYAWELTCGPIPKGLYVLHRCDVRACCRPGHLVLGTQRENMDDMVYKGRSKQNCGSKNSRSKLTEDNVRAIRELRITTGLPYKEIAHRFGVSERNAQTVVARDTWKHVK